MIVECYSSDVYCDCEDHEYGKPGCYSRPDNFTGRGKRSTDRQRRQAGWIKVRGKDVCPTCKCRNPICFKDDE